MDEKNKEMVMMEFETFEISDLILVKPPIFGDERGYFIESFNSQKYHSLGIQCTFVQDNESMSKANVVRGLHFQKPPFAQTKLVRVVKGAIIDVAVDIRKNSATYGKYVAVRLDDVNKHQLFIPEGFAHGFLSLSDDTIVSYKCNQFYHKESEGTLFWNDPILSIDWNVNNVLISSKDTRGENFATFASPF